MLTTVATILPHAEWLNDDQSLRAFCEQMAKLNGPSQHQIDFSMFEFKTVACLVLLLFSNAL